MFIKQDYLISHALSRSYPHESLTLKYLSEREINDRKEDIEKYDNTPKERIKNFDPQFIKDFREIVILSKNRGIYFFSKKASDLKNKMKYFILSISN